MIERKDSFDFSHYSIKDRVKDRICHQVTFLSFSN